jgi:hypothetical protein
MTSTFGVAPAVDDWQEMNDKYQAVIDAIYSTHGKSESTIYAAYFLACAIKECMTHKDSDFGADHGYIHEKIGRALRELGMKEVSA